MDLGPGFFHQRLRRDELRPGCVEFCFSRVAIRFCGIALCHRQVVGCLGCLDIVAWQQGAGKQRLLSLQNAFGINNRHPRFLKLGVPTHHIRACRFDARTHIVHIGQGVFDLGPGGIQIGLSLHHLGTEAGLV